MVMAHEIAVFEKDQHSKKVRDFQPFLHDNQPPISCPVCPTKSNLQNR